MPAVALIVVGFCLSLRAAEPPVLWPRQVDVPPNKNALKACLDFLDSAAGTQPQELKPAVQFQKLFLQIVSGVPRADWSGEVEKLANSSGQSPVEAGVREISRVWLSRLEMADIDTALRNYYRRNVSFPATFAEVEADLPEKLRKDPWGEPWVYQPHAPKGFERLSTQRYQLGPSQFPKLGTLSDAVGHRDPPGQSWQIALHDVGGNKALEFRSAEAGASVAIIQPGGKVGDCTLLFIGEHWALMAGVDQIFAVVF